MLPYGHIEEPSGVKRLIKRAIRRLLSWLLLPLFEETDRQAAALVAAQQQLTQHTVALDSAQQQLAQQAAALDTARQELTQQIAVLDIVQQKITQQAVVLDNTHQQLAQQAATLDIAQRHLQKNERIKGSLARDLMRTKWQLRDHLNQAKDESARELYCGICGYHAPLYTFETKETDCIFDGGHLERYVCPNCGCVFGPTKFRDQTQEEFNDDYVVHYAGYHEGDSTHKELFAFQLLKPEKDKVYLDYGCGSWSHTIPQLREQGYNVYGYEPYAEDVGNPYIFTNRSVLSEMQFDGIFSNDVLEHLADPISELQFMRSILRDKSCRMSHCTGCYLYKYEYTRFHMFFFTGNSVNIMAKKAGLNIIDSSNEPVTDDPCYLFGVQPMNVMLTEKMRTSGALRDDGSLSAGPGEVIFGPYLTLSTGIYRFLLEVEFPNGADEVPCHITIDRGKTQLTEFMLHNGENTYELTLSEQRKDLEFVIRNTNSEIVILKNIWMQR